MKTLSLMILVLACGCAATAPAISQQQRQTFYADVAHAEASCAQSGSERAQAQVREAKEDFYYAEHSPSDPERSRRMARQAEEELQAALELAKGGTSQASVASVSPAISVTP